MQSPEYGIAVENCRAWLQWAATQVDACLADDRWACDQLLESLADLLRQAPSAANRGSPGEVAVAERTASVVIAVQSHDRIMQRLAHVADSLRMLRDLLGDAPRALSDDSWKALRERQLRAFSMAEERALFIRIVAPEGSDGAIDSHQQDTVELFDAAGSP